MIVRYALAIAGLYFIASSPRPMMAEDADLTSTQSITKIAFGSCAKETEKQPIWDTIADEKPDLFIFLGDNVYGDTEDMRILRLKYAVLARKPGYRRLIQHTKVLGTWDDHDYGVNDGGAEYLMKKESKEILLDFLGEPKDTARRKREGIYASYLYGDPPNRLQIILLDLRTFRSSLIEGPERETTDGTVMGEYLPNDDPNATMLGEAQWKWLEEQFRIPADLRLIGSSTQFLVEFNGYEAWANLPHERKRMFDLIRETKANGVIFLSGDTHWGELAVEKRDGLYPIYDLTSSGLTQTWHGFGPNKHRVGETYGEPNFGWIEIDWGENRAASSVHISVRDIKGATQIEQRLTLNELSWE